MYTLYFHYNHIPFQANTHSLSFKIQKDWYMFLTLHEWIIKVIRKKEINRMSIHDVCVACMKPLSEWSHLLNWMNVQIVPSVFVSLSYMYSNNTNTLVRYVLSTLLRRKKRVSEMNDVVFKILFYTYLHNSKTNMGILTPQTKCLPYTEKLFHFE